MTLTEDLLRKLAPRARADYIEAMTSAEGAATFEKWGINTPARMAAFLATILHESGELTIIRENMTYKSASRIAAVWPSRFSVGGAAGLVGNPKALANKVYGGRMGNERNGTNDDDGYRYRGAGLIQTTGRDSFRAAGEAIGVDLDGNPELIEKASVSLAAACWEASKWHKYADMGERGFRAYSNAINRGNPAAKADPIGWADRQRCYRKVMDVLGAVKPAVPDDILEVGDHGPLVEAYQKRLIELGYATGRADGIFGPRTRVSVLAFQAENVLATDGQIGPITRAALNSEAAKPMPVGDRANEGKVDLLAKGDNTVATAETLKTVAKAAAAVTVVSETASQVDVLGWAKNTLGEFSQLKTVITAMQDAVGFMAQHWWIAALVGSYFIYRWASTIEFERIIKHRLGLDVSK